MLQSSTSLYLDLTSDLKVQLKGWVASEMHEVTANLLITTVFPPFLHFTAATSFLQTQLIHSLSLFFVLHLIVIHVYVHITGVIYALFCFQHPILLKVRLPGIKQSELLFPPTHPTSAEEFMAKPSPLRQKPRSLGPC